MVTLQSIAKVGNQIRRSAAEASTAVAAPQNEFRAMDGYHALLRAFYANTIYEDVAAWQPYRSRYRLPRALRSIFNPTRRAVDFYSGAVYPGAWTEDARPTPTGRPCAIRFSPMDLSDRPELVLATMQFLDWGNWSAERMVYVREGAKIGSVFVQILDDLDSGKVRPEIVPLEDLAKLDLSPGGNVKAFTIEYQAIDQDGTSYRYRKEVNRDSIMIWRNDRIESEEANPTDSRPESGCATGTWAGCSELPRSTA
jgi:hypothetical protein